MDSVLNEIVGGLTSGVSKMGEGIGSGLSSLVQNMFLKVNESGAIEGLSTFGIVLVVFAGVSLAIGLSRLVYRFVSSLGARK